MNKKWFFILIGIIALYFYIGNSSSESKTSIQGVESTFTPPTSIPKPTDIILNTAPKPQLYFNNYPCTEDCSGHEAGYEWAEEKGIDNADECGGNSDSFIEGCQSYVEENYSEDEDSSENEDYY